MTPQEARILILEDALSQAHHTVSFLHGCLTSKDFNYGYPHQTLETLKEWENLIDIPEGCMHSRFHKDCNLCQIQKVRQSNLREARKVMEVI